VNKLGFIGKKTWSLWREGKRIISFCKNFFGIRGFGVSANRGAVHRILDEWMALGDHNIIGRPQRVAPTGDA